VARETAAYIRSFSGNGPQVGDIEAYPSRSVADLEGWIKALENQGAKPAFFHLDANIHRLDVDRRVDATGDLRELKRFFLAEQIPFGIIFWPGYNPVTSEQNYYERTMSWVRRVEAAIGRPDHVIFQSWVVRGGQNTCSNTDPRCNMQNPMCTPSDPASCGKKSVPVNLPDNDPGVFSHTRLIVDALKILR
jgi:hypothetical protein